MINKPGFRAGLIGRHLGHSFSPQIHALLADYSYRLIELEPDEVGDYIKDGGYDAVNVTIPYKKTVMPFLSEISPEAEALGAVNTVTRTANGLRGDNTDYHGFLFMLRRSGIEVEGKKVLVLGSGGAGVTVCAVLRDCGADVTVISRSGSNNYSNINYNADVIVNTTPVGMFPQVGVSPVCLDRFTRCSGVLDLIYNPARTQLILDAQRLGIPCSNGLPMLVSQAKKSCEIFLNQAIDERETERIIDRIAFESANIVLVGMPGSGKSVAGAALAKLLGREFVDTDREIEKNAGITIPEIFSRFGEDEFRRLESEAIREAGKRSSLVIATGGGAVKRSENYNPLHQNGTIVFLQRELTELAVEGRPLSQTNSAEKLYNERLPKYQSFSDCSALCSEDVDCTVSNIISSIKGVKTP